MKTFLKSICILFFAIGSLALHAQVPQGINYQAVVRGSNGEIITNENVIFTFSVISSLNNDELYSEAHFTATNEFGLVNLVIGTGTPTISTFDQLDWEIPYLLHTYVTIEATTIDMGISDLQSVPYALNAGSAMALSPSATVSAQQIEGGNAQINQILQFNGTNWVAANLPQGNGSGFDLPYAETDTYNQALLQVTNTNLGAIEGFSTNGVGVYGSSSNNTAISGVSFGNPATIYGANFSSGVGVKGYSEDGIGVAGQSNSSAGQGVFGFNSAGHGIKGQTSKDGYAGVLGMAEGSSCKGVYGYAEGSFSNGVRGSSTDGIGVYGTSDSFTGVSGYGETGVKGNSPGGNGVWGESASGVGVLAESSQGVALETNGVVKIAGTSQQPAQGKVLTSDAQGNATWEGAVAFAAWGGGGQVIESNASLPEKVLFTHESYDLSNSYNLNTRIFTAPSHGIYHFDAQSDWQFMEDDMETFIYIQAFRNGQAFILLSRPETIIGNGRYENSITGDFELLAGDQIWLGIGTHNSDDPALMDTGDMRFSGRLVIKL